MRSHLRNGVQVGSNYPDRDKESRCMRVPNNKCKPQNVLRVPGSPRSRPERGDSTALRRRELFADANTCDNANDFENYFNIIFTCIMSLKLPVCPLQRPLLPTTDRAGTLLQLQSDREANHSHGGPIMT